MLVRRAFCNGGTDLYYLTYFSHQLLGNSSSKKCELTPEGTSKSQRWDFHAGLFQMIRPPLQQGANSPAWYKDEMWVLFSRTRQQAGRTILAARVVQNVSFSSYISLRSKYFYPQLPHQETETGYFRSACFSKSLRTEMRGGNEWIQL